MPTPHEMVEAELTSHGLSLPETDLSRGWGPTRVLRVRGKMFCVFGDKDEPLDALTIIVKLPISFDMVQDLSFVRESRGWWRQHQWAIAHFAAADDVSAELETLKGWMRQSYVAVAPKMLGRRVGGSAAERHT